MPKKTQHYQLNQYEPQDSFLRTDFNEDNAKIDAALHATPKIRMGSYTGTAEHSDRTVQSIDLGGQPKAVLLMPHNGRISENYVFGGIFAPDAPLFYNRTKPENWVARVTPTGFEVRNIEPHCVNEKNLYYYIAVM